MPSLSYLSHSRQQDKKDHMLTMRTDHCHLLLKISGCLGFGHLPSLQGGGMQRGGRNCSAFAFLAAGIGSIHQGRFLRVSGVSTARGLRLLRARIDTAHQPYRPAVCSTHRSEPPTLKVEAHTLAVSAASLARNDLGARSVAHPNTLKHPKPKPSQPPQRPTTHHTHRPEP